MDLPGHEGDIPTPMTSAYVATIKNTEDQTTLPSNNGSGSSKKINVVVANKVVRYRECLKNHAASMGGNATDGCGEFMPSGEEGTLEALKCSACNCHRNFHRKEVEGDQPFSCHGEQLFPYGYKGALRYNMPRLHHQQQPPALIMPLGAIQSSESDEIGGDVGHGNFGFGGEMMMRGPPVSAAKKRFRTKFTQEQKEKMLGFAERVGWKLQRQEEGLVQQFCQEVGVKRRVLKVWMHNNKNSLGKKMSSNLQIQ